MKWNTDYNRSNLKWKLAVLAAVMILLVVLVIVQAGQRRKERREYQETMKQTRIQEQEEKKENTDSQSASQKEDQDNMAKENTDQNDADQEINGQNDTGQKNAGAQSTKADQKGSGIDVCIVNLDEFAETVMGENTYLLTERLEGWIEENQLNAKKGTIFHVMVPESDPQSINFYLRLSDKRGSLVMLSYHPRENIVTASICNYTEEEIKDEVWEADNGPAERDVPAEADTGSTEVQEGTDDITGEN